MMKNIKVKDKVLIFTNYTLNVTDGGPSGFLAQNLLGHSSDYYEIHINSNISYQRLLYEKFNYYLPKTKYELNASGINKTFEFKRWGLDSYKIFKRIQAHKYKFIYFHDVYQLKVCLPLIHQSQVVILQPHSPELPSQEVATQTRFTQEDITWAKKAEQDAFKRANILIFPNQYAVEIYTSLISSKSTIYYLNSGAKEVNCVRKYPLDDKIQLLFIGRRNHIKGFDIVLEAFREAYQKRKDINLVILGNGTKIDEDGIFDIGFSSSPHDWIYSCDYVINCNRQSYFDLSVLETLSIGTPLIISTNFGHKQFAHEMSKGIINIGQPTVRNLTNILLSEALTKKIFNQQGVNENTLLFKSKFTDSIYRKNLENLLKTIISTN